MIQAGGQERNYSNLNRRLTAVVQEKEEKKEMTENGVLGWWTRVPYNALRFSQFFTE